MAFEVSAEIGTGTGRPLRRRHARWAEGLAAAWLVVVIAAALLAPMLDALIGLPDPSDSFSGMARRGPAHGHPLGGDGNGRDVLARLVFGARTSMVVGVSSVLFGTLVGGPLGLLAGYRRGRLGSIVSGFFDVVLAFPPLILALGLVAVLASGDDVSDGRRISVLILALGVIAVPVLGRVVRAATLTWAQREFVLAARALGTPDRRIIVREVLPNVLPAVSSVALLLIALIIVAEGGLSLLGVGVQLPTPSWGNMIAEGRVGLRQAPHVVFAPTVAIFLTVLSLNHLGDVVRGGSNGPREADS